MFGMSRKGYDRSTSIFSPEGRIFAAEYAKKAVEQGATSIGTRCEEGVVLLAEKKVMPLQEPDSVEKISKIDEHIGVATSGFMADARTLIQEARVKAQSYWLTYEESIPAEALADHICDIKAQFTQGGGARPYGVAMIIGSVDDNGIPQLFVTDPVGTYWGFFAAVIGRGNTDAGEYLQEHYEEDLNITESTNLALNALKATTESGLTADNVEIAQIPVSTSRFTKLSNNEVTTLLEQNSEAEKK
ncbi:MAG: archaeal proteasome endopeptidase complex subunit alpha [Candidatus Thorarchaeota archaeon]